MVYDEVKSEVQLASGRPGAESARRVLDLLFAFTETPVASVKELSEAAAIPVPTAHRYIAMLRDAGLVDEAGRGRYRLSLRVTKLSQAARRATTIIDCVAPHLTTLAGRINETVMLNQPVANMMVCTYRVEVYRHLRLSFEVGDELPALSGASASLFVGSLSPELRRGYVESMIARGAQSPCETVDEYLENAARSLARGWASSEGEIDEGVSAVSCPLYAESGFVGAISVPIPSSRFTPERLDEVLPELQECASTVNEVLAGS